MPEDMVQVGRTGCSSPKGLQRVAVGRARPCAAQPRRRHRKRHRRLRLFAFGFRGCRPRTGFAERVICSPTWRPMHGEEDVNDAQSHTRDHTAHNLERPRREPRRVPPPPIKPTRLALPAFHVDAFTGGLSTGNPAAVRPPRRQVAHPMRPHDSPSPAEHQPLRNRVRLKKVRARAYGLRWFTPTVEVPLCGHATLAASAHALTTCRLRLQDDVFTFDSGALPAHASRPPGPPLELDFPTRPRRPAPRPRRSLSGRLATNRLRRPKPATLLPSLPGRGVRALRPDFPAPRPTRHPRRHRHRSRKRTATLFPGFSPRRRHQRGSRHRLRALHAHAVLGPAPRQDQL